MKNQELYNQRLKKAKKMARLLSNIPFVRQIYLTGSMANKNIKYESDIDFFVQTKKGRIWTVRALIVFLLSMIGEYRIDSNIAGKICPNWYATFNAPQKNKRKYEVLISNNSLFSKSAEVILSGGLGNIIEKKFKQYQIKRFTNDPRTYGKYSETRFSDEELGFHPHDKI